MSKTCFVVMPIGEQNIENIKITEEDLKKRYTDLIKEAILKARPDLEVIRADEVSKPGGMTTDIFMRLALSDYVVVDITFPNLNVFYELGIRHACRPGAVVIYDKKLQEKPFDVTNERSIPYENTASGLKDLAEKLAKRFDWLDQNKYKPDNQFLEVAKTITYEFPEYSKKEEKEEALIELVALAAQDPDLMELIMAHSRGETTSQEETLRKLSRKPEVLKKMLRLLLKGISLF